MYVIWYVIMIHFVLNSEFYRWNAQNIILVSKKSRKKYVHVYGTVSAKCKDVTFTFTWNDPFCVQAYNQEDICCDLWIVDELILVYVTEETPPLIFSNTVSMRRQKWKYRDSYRNLDSIRGRQECLQFFNGFLWQRETF